MSISDNLYIPETKKKLLFLDTVQKGFVSHTVVSFNVERLEFLRYKILADLMIYGRFDKQLFRYKYCRISFVFRCVSDRLRLSVSKRPETDLTIKLSKRRSKICI